MSAYRVTTNGKYWRVEVRRRFLWWTWWSKAWVPIDSPAHDLGRWIDLDNHVFLTKGSACLAMEWLRQEESCARRGWHEDDGNGREAEA